MHLYSYIVARDFGFAPNPFNGVCTLATCKPKIRKAADVDDWIIGTGPKKNYNIPRRLIYAMRVTDKMTFNEYWESPLFRLRKPKMNGSIKQAFGDNIYYFDDLQNQWHQEDSHHSYSNGVINQNNLDRDTQAPLVLISSHFYYFGSNNIEIPDDLKAICVSGQGYKKNHPEELILAFLQWLEGNYSPGYYGNPIQFSSFQRYNGVS
jgi:hypothetical protein